MIKLDTIKVLISKALIDLHVSHDQCNSVNNVIREYNEMKEKLKNPENTENILYENNGNIFCQLQEKYCKEKF